MAHMTHSLIYSLRNLVGPIYENNLKGLFLLIFIFTINTYICWNTDEVFFAYCGAIVVTTTLFSGLYKYINDNFEPKVKKH